MAQNVYSTKEIDAKVNTLTAEIAALKEQNTAQNARIAGASSSGAGDCGESLMTITAYNRAEIDATFKKLNDDVAAIKAVEAQQETALNALDSGPQVGGFVSGVYRWEPPHAPDTIIEFEQQICPVESVTAFNGIDEGRWDYVNGDGMAWQLGPWRDFRASRPGLGFMYSVGLMPSNIGVTLAQIANGQYDQHYTKLANNLAKYGMLDAILRMGYEMDGSWFPWTASPGSGKEGYFAAAVKRIVKLMRQAQPGNKWKFMWNPTADDWPKSAGTAYFESLWPGDEYIDIVGIDAYDGSFVSGKAYYPSGSNRYQRQQKVWSDLLTRLNMLRDFAFKHGKVLSFPEWALRSWPSGHEYEAYGGGDNPYFIEQMYKYMTDPANKVANHSYFDNWNTWEGDSSLTSGKHSQAAAKYRELFGA